MQQTGKRITVSDYFRQHQNKPLQYPFLPCVEVSSGALVPFELCDVPPGQIMRKQVPSERTKDVLDFATKRPSDRLASINAGLSILNYGQSEYMAAFGMQVNTAAGPIKVQARVLKPPTLKYGPGSRQPTIVPNAGSWNMVDKKFFKAATIRQFVMAIYEQKGRFPPEAANDVVRGLVQCCKQVGMGIADNVAALAWENGQGDITKQLRDLGNECKQKTGIHPDLIVAILPEGASDIYHAIKHFGDVKAGVATQCLKSTKCFRAKPQYYANVCLKMNVKMGGINTIPEPMSVSALTDPRNPTLVLGADVIHPAPGSDGRPSFTALVGNVDSDTAKYIATIQVQASRQEMIEDLYEMSKHILSFYMRYRDKMEKKGANSPPKRIIFYRDGVSEGQFRQVLELELPKLQAACRDLNINAKITVIVVGKRHHYRMFPLDPRDADRSGNCPAGTVVDQGIAHPVEFDFYLQSHGGLLGTSRPAHYNVLYDENNFTADGLQSLSYALCHVYARSTRSVSIPAPVYYADIVCSRAKNHYEPSTGFDFSESATQLDSGQAMSSIEKFKQNFRPLHQNMATVMYFS
jgi:eukaryotic translation initiation factor 2C